jgi:hypothetical protein
MFGKTIHLTHLELRKRLLVAESELNRAQLAEEWHAMTDEVHEVARWAGSVVAWASSAALLVAGIKALRRSRSGPSSEKSSWFTMILRAARVVSTLWLALRATGRKEEGK